MRQTSLALAGAATAAAISALQPFSPSALCSDATSPRPNAPRPNILFCIADDASYAHFAANGCPWVKTPAFDRIAREGIRFTRAYTPNSKCSPSRACVLTGRNSWQLESAANHGGYYPAGYRTFMEALALHGYATGCTGKSWAPGNPGKIDDKPRQLTGPNFSRQKTKPPTDKISNTDYAANFDDFLAKRDKTKPFAFWYGGHEPHRRYGRGSGITLGGKKLTDIDRVPPIWPDTDEIRSDLLDYAFEIEYFDQHLGRIIAALERAGELDNTLIIVTSDNGMPWPRSKGSTYELSLHEPLAIRWPAGIAQPGRVCDDYVSFIDIAPTILELAGLTAQTAGMEPITGSSLMPILRNDTCGQPVPGRDRLITGQERHDLGRPDDVGYPVRGLFKNGCLYLHNFEPSRWPMCDPITGYLNTDGSPVKTAILEENRRGINHWRWELCFGRRPAEELYDLQRDPDCLNNLAFVREQQARVTAMREELFAELKKQNDPRISGKGDVFDRYPTASPLIDLYNRWMKGDPSWPGSSDKTNPEAPGFDPERPLAPQTPDAAQAASPEPQTQKTHQTPKKSRASKKAKPPSQ